MEMNDERVRVLYKRRFATPPSLVVVQPTAKSFDIYSEAYQHLKDVFRFDETLPECDFEKIPKNVPVLMVGPGNRHGIMAEDYPWDMPICNMQYLVKLGHYREYYEAVTGRRYLHGTLKMVEHFRYSLAYSTEEFARTDYEIGLRERTNIIGFWPYSMDWALWHGLSGVFCADIIMDENSARLQGYNYLTTDEIVAEQKRLTEMIRRLIKPWPTHSLNLEALEMLKESPTTIAAHNNQSIFVIEDRHAVAKYMPTTTLQFPVHHKK